MTLVNVDPLNTAADGAPDPAHLLGHGFRGVRFAIRDDDAIRNYVLQCKTAGLATLGIITEAAHGYVMDDEPCDIYQIGNEPDRGAIDAPYVQGNDIMGAGAYVNYWNMYWNVWFASGQRLAGKTVIGAGLASGQTSYWKAVLAAGGLQGAAGFALHPYGASAWQAQALIMRYRALSPSLSVWITEWNRPASQVVEYAAMLRRLTGVAADAWFCWHQYEQWALGEERARLLGLAA